MKLFEIFKKKTNKPVAKTGNHVVDFYTAHCDEEARLLSKHGSVEFLTTVRYVEQYLKEGNKIIEIGAGTGRYSHYFAQKGFEVEAAHIKENVGSGRVMQKIGMKQIPYEETVYYKTGKNLDANILDFYSISK